MKRSAVLSYGLLLLLWGLSLAATGAADQATSNADRSRLLEGIREIAAPGVPGSLAVYGREAFPVVAGKTEGSRRAAVMAAARMGKGRIVAFGHDGYFGTESLAAADTGRLLKNSVQWTAAGGANPRVGTVGLPDLLAFLKAAGVDAREARLGDDLSGFHVLVITHSGVTETAIPRIRAFVEGGGGLVAASTGWGWAQITGKPIPQHPLSQITDRAGLVWTGGMLERTAEKGFDAAGAIPRLVHAGEAIDALLAKAEVPAEESAQAVSSVLLAARSLPAADTTLRPRLQTLRSAAGAAAIPGEKTPVTLKTPLQRLALALDTEEALRAPAGEVKAHASAPDFPGAVPPDASRVTRRLALDTAITGWHSTGLYAAPGDKVTVTIPAQAARKGLAVRIGAHTDELWHLPEWKRAPAVSRLFPVRSETTEAASAFGGLVYVVVPANTGLGRPEVTVSGAVEAPYFRRGETDPAAWRASIRSRPAPWAELAGDRVVLTVPSGLVRSLEDPASLMKLWDRVVEAQDTLAHLPPRKQPERILADRQISAGYMHSGYPIMTPIDGSTTLALDERKLRAEGSWGHFHELGHNHQSPDWTFDGTGEVTCNVLAMYVYPTVLGLPFDSGHPAIRDRRARMERVRKHIEAGAPFAAWKRDPFLALTMYIQLIEGFGWDPFLKVFAEYRALPDNTRPRTDAQKRDQWLVRFSRTVGKNLGPFFQTWGVPTSDVARASVADLPAWMPAEMPQPK
jgi:enhancin-like peptidase M60 family/peptidase M60-like protein